MVSIPRHRNKNGKNQHAWVIFLLLALLVIGKVPFEFLHRTLHDHDRVDLHTPLQEKDPCHQTIYHNQKNSCHHSTHLTTSPSCAWCTLTISNDPWINPLLPTGTVLITAIHENSCSTLFTPCVLFDQSSRAPPNLIKSNSPHQAG